MKIIPAAEECLVIQVADQQSESALNSIGWLSEIIIAELGHWVTDVVPSYTTLAVYYDILSCDYQAINGRLTHLIAQYVHQQPSVPARQIELPVYYGPEVAVDMATVAKQTHLTPAQIVTLHSGQSYRVYALGFRPGFAFMGTVPVDLRIPRLATPRSNVPQGAVAIAEAQTSVYPSSSPGGWNIVGNCPLMLFDSLSVNPGATLRAGDEVRFKPVTREEFVALGGELSAS